MNFLGYKIPGYVIAASCPATENIENIMECAANGAAAIILKSSSSERMFDNGTRRCFINKMGFWAESSFDREIMPLGDAIKLTKTAIKSVNIPIIPSVTELTIDSDKWVESCLALENAGASALQLDFFYLPNLLHDNKFQEKFIHLLKSVTKSCRVPIMPKLSIGLPAEFSAHMLRLASIEHVSLLDSIRSPAPMGQSHLSGNGLSVFGTFMLPITRQYTKVLSDAGLSVCAGGGVTNAKDAAELINLGASVIQIATDVLLNGFVRFREIDSEISKYLSLQSAEKETQHIRVEIDLSKCVNCKKCKTQTFCNIIKSSHKENSECENCGFCSMLCNSGAICKTYVNANI